jgi:hypothetical protein
MSTPDYPDWSGADAELHYISADFSPQGRRNNAGHAVSSSFPGMMLKVRVNFGRGRGRVTQDRASYLQGLARGNRRRTQCMTERVRGHTRQVSLCSRPCATCRFLRPKCSGLNDTPRYPAH